MKSAIFAPSSATAELLCSQSSHKQAQPAEAGLAAKAPLQMTSLLPSVPSVMSQSQFPPLLSWAPQSASASLTTPRGAFDSLGATPAHAPNDNDNSGLLPATLSFDLADLQPVPSATFGGLPASPSSVAARLERSMAGAFAGDACGSLGPADLLSLADTLALNSILPQQRSGAFVAGAAELPLTQSLILGGLQPTPSFMALAGAESRVFSSSRDEAEDNGEGHSDTSSYTYEEDDVMSLSSSLIDLSHVVSSGKKKGLVLTREQARAAASADPSSGAKRKRRAKVAVPDEKKDEKYWRRREKNNEAARRNRMMKKAFEGVQKDRLPELNSEKARLTDEVSLLRAELKHLKAVLRQQLLEEGLSVENPIFTH